VARPKSPPRIAGRVSVHRDGFGFVIPSKPIPWMEGDLFIPPKALHSAMNGDQVMAKIVRRQDGGRAEGEIVKVVDRAHPTIVGTFRVSGRRQFVEPFDNRLSQWVEIPSGKETPPSNLEDDRIGAEQVEFSGPADLEGMVVNVEILRFPKQSKGPSGRVIEVLGHPDDFGVDVEVMIRKHHIPHRFPPEVLDQAQRAPKVIHQSDVAGRRDFRGYDCVTIDGETARDFDDAVWVDLLENGNYALHVHIADVSHYVLPGSHIDREAELRGTSVYFPDRAVPMLPLELSTEICSLNPKVDRLTMSALLEIDHQGQIVSQEFTRGIIRSVERMTYTSVHLILKGDAGLRDRYAPLVARFEMMRDLALILNRMRNRRGAIDFDLPEPLIEFDEFGAMTGIGRSPRNIAHRLIEEFMLIANEAVAVHLESAAVNSLYRIHEIPDPGRVMDFEEMANQFGISLGVKGLGYKKAKKTDRQRGGRRAGKEVDVPADGIKITPRHYQKLVRKIEGKPEERILSYLMLRSLKQAKYSDENRGHFALASNAYTHFTSPIRRYPDLMVHRILGEVLDHEKPGYQQAKLHEIGDTSSASERRSADAERELVEWKKIKFMTQHVGDEFPALITNTISAGFFVELEEFFVEGLVAVDTLPGEKWGYDETTRQITGARSGRAFSIGDRLTVRLDRVDVVERKLVFSLASELPQKPGRTRKNKNK
jgi:ribonuclease R